MKFLEDQGFNINGPMEEDQPIDQRHDATQFQEARVQLLNAEKDALVAKLETRDNEILLMHKEN
jgi:hypothetical protein